MISTHVDTPGGESSGNDSGFQVARLSEFFALHFLELTSTVVHNQVQCLITKYRAKDSFSPSMNDCGATA